MTASQHGDAHEVVMMQSNGITLAQNNWSVSRRQHIKEPLPFAPKGRDIIA